MKRLSHHAPARSLPVLNGRIPALLVFCCVVLGTKPAFADVFRDFRIDGMQIIPRGGGLYDVIVDAPVIPGTEAPIENIIVRLLQNGPVADIVLPTAGRLPPKACCVNTCAGVPNWNVKCTGRCDPNPGAPKVCEYTSKLAFVEGIPLEAGAKLVAIADPDGMHVETGPDAESNNSFVAIVPCPSDVNLDGAVNVLDLVELLLCFGEPATPPCHTGQDVNNDGAVNVLDLVELLLAFGTTCP